MLAFRQATFKKDIEKDRIYEKLAPLPTIVADSLLQLLSGSLGTLNGIAEILVCEFGTITVN